MNPSCYEDWCDAVQARARREDEISEAADHLRTFLASITQGSQGDIREIKKALALLSPSSHTRTAIDGLPSLESEQELARARAELARLEREEMNRNR